MFLYDKLTAIKRRYPPTPSGFSTGSTTHVQHDCALCRACTSTVPAPQRKECRVGVQEERHLRQPRYKLAQPSARSFGFKWS